MSKTIISASGKEDKSGNNKPNKNITPPPFRKVKSVNNNNSKKNISIRNIKKK